MPWIYGLTLSNSLYDLGLCNPGLFGTRLNVVIRTMELWVFVNYIGGQDADINAPWERWEPNLGLGSYVSLSHS